MDVVVDWVVWFLKLYVKAVVGYVFLLMGYTIITGLL